MKLDADGLFVSPTDLAYFLSCRHRTALEMAEAHGERTRPEWKDPLLEALFELGLEHERRYVGHLERSTPSIVSLADVRDQAEAVARTRQAMRQGREVIVQAALAEGRWYGRPDILRRVERPSPRFGSWSYEIADTKLARETRGGTILQLGLYSQLLEHEQGLSPEYFSVVVPGEDAGDAHVVRRYRVAEYAAYFRLIKARFEATVGRSHEALFDEHYPDPVDHCEICAWAPQCRDRRRADDHLSLVAGISRLQRRMLAPVGIVTVEALAALGDPIPFTPARGSIDTYERVRDQAALQVRTRREGRVAFELLPIATTSILDPVSGSAPEPAGLARLPAPSPGDVFLDLEGDPLAGNAGREYLFGLATVDPDRSVRYQAFWADDAAAERRAFEQVVDVIAARLQSDPGAHVYHYAPYEPSAFKRLMGRYSTREREIDQLLRGRRFVDLYAVIRQGLRVGVERYSIKNLEPLYAFARAVNLRDASRALRTMEQALELDRPSLATAAVRRTVEAYNRDDCLSTLRLRDWLEERRADLVALGHAIPRPVNPSGDAAEHLDDRARAVEAVRGQLLAGVDENLPAASARDAAHFRLAYLLDYHRREDKAFWWEYFRLRELPEDELFDEPSALAGLEFVGELGTVAKSFLHRYRYPPQEMELRPGMKLKTQDGRDFGEVLALDRDDRIVDLKVGPTRRPQRPTALINREFVNAKVIEQALLDLGERVVAAGGVDRLEPCAAQSLLLRLPPRGAAREPGERVPAFAERGATMFDRTVLPMQGPPGSGKTYTGARMICALVAAGRKVGVAGPSHKVIRKLLDDAAAAACERGIDIAIGHKDKADDASVDPIEHQGGASLVSFTENDAALAAIESGRIQVLGGTAWLWARPEFANAVDVLFVDEAGQMSLANTLAIAGAANSVVLLGDPQQLDQPTQGSHPEGVGVSALQHVLGEAPTMPADRGLFLPLTWRLAPAICAFTSELFYDGQLQSKPGLERQALAGTPGFDGAGLWLATVPHDGNTNASDEEVAAVVDLTRSLLSPGSRWLSEEGSAALTENDILIVAPFNAQVSRIKDALGPRFRVGTVDKFQGQEAPVVIYSMTTSRPEDAPRGLGFLFSRNRLNVATSRARCAVILVASPWLFEADCVTPRQMRLANALCRFREMAKAVPAPDRTRPIAEPEPQRLFD
ncbi:MAG TPA: TM0106 family RecB-like putative nuclease [Vicinamibacterales bacterium]|nr:TM0106 family RecB-like putative nuclease [Vicinamibacterales bacterium]